MYKRLALLLATSVIISASAAATVMEKSRSAAAVHYADSVYQKLSLRQRIAQIFIPCVNPRNLSSAKGVINQYVVKDEVGGLIFNSADADDYVEMISYAQSQSKVPLMMTVDGEWGMAMRIKEANPFPYNIALGAIRNERLLYEYGKEVARQCREFGITANFAPVLDVNTNPKNPVIGYRSFGDNPQRVAMLGTAFSKGLEDGGVLSCAKHFPGHGDTDIDSHKALPTVNHSLKELVNNDLVPFADYIKSGLSSVMIGHINVPAIDNSGAPASLSKKAVTELLKNNMHFDGLIFTDALAMKGAKSAKGKNNCVIALKAGVDILLQTSSPHHDIDAVERAVKSGEIKMDVIESKCKKMLRYKYALGLSNAIFPSKTGIVMRINSPYSVAVNRKLRKAMMTVVTNPNSLLPIKRLDTTSIAIVNIGGQSANSFTTFCAKYAKENVYSSTIGSFTQNQISGIRKADLVVIAVHSDKAASMSGYAQLKKSLKGRRVVDVFFVNPYKVAKFVGVDKNAALLMAYDDDLISQEMAAQAIFGGIEVDGRLPVGIAGVAKSGDGISLKKVRLAYSTPVEEGFSPLFEAKVDSIARGCIKAKAFPGCQVLVAKNGNVILSKSYGHTDYTSGIAVDENTIYDLASVTKTIGTLPGVMKLFDLGKIKLDDKASDFIPELKSGDKASITIRQLLFHESGMQPSLNMFSLMMDTASYTGKLIAPKKDSTHSRLIEKGAYGHNSAKLRADLTSPTKTEKFPIEADKGIYVSEATIDTVFKTIYTSKLRPNKSYCYSCLNFCLLMDIEQRITGEKHNIWIDKEVFSPLGAYHTFYRPLQHVAARHIAPTETDNFLRKQVVHGYVHDELANFSGGVQGNAGLFANAEDVAKVCQLWLNGGSYGCERIFSESTVRLFTTTKSASKKRGLGFDTNDNNTYGHTGFTGTCFWIDPKEGLVYVFLSNRVLPSRNNAAFSKLSPRSAVFNAIYRDLKI